MRVLLCKQVNEAEQKLALVAVAVQVELHRLQERLQPQRAQLVRRYRVSQLSVTAQRPVEEPSLMHVYLICSPTVQYDAQCRYKPRNGSRYASSGKAQRRDRFLYAILVVLSSTSSSLILLTKHCNNKADAYPPQLPVFRNYAFVYGSLINQ